MAPSSNLSVPMRRLGKGGPEVPAQGLGLMGLSVFYGKTEPDAQRFEFLDHALASGNIFWDSSDAYGDSEELVGKWFERTGKRNEIFIATKFGIVWENGAFKGVNNEPSYVRECCDKSLKRLKTNYIDLFYVHRINPETPIERTMGALVELVKEGKIKHIGLSECSAETLRRANAVHPVACVQLEYSPWSLEIEHSTTQLLSTCRELGVATIAYSPLGRGFLTGTLRSRADLEQGDYRLNSPRFSEENFPKNLQLADKLKALADKKGCTAGQLALAWLTAQGDDIIPIPGTKKIKYLDDNWGALGLKITPEENKEIRAAIDGADIQGDRYAKAMMSSLFVTTVKA